jgi:hypothetical protein
MVMICAAVSHNRPLPICNSVRYCCCWADRLPAQWAQMNRTVGRLAGRGPLPEGLGFIAMVLMVGQRARQTPLPGGWFWIVRVFQREKWRKYCREGEYFLGVVDARASSWHDRLGLTAFGVQVTHAAFLYLWCERHL